MFMEYTGLEGSHQSHRVEKYYIARHICTKSDLYCFLFGYFLDTHEEGGGG